MAKKNATQDPGMPMPILNRIEEDLVPTVDARALHKWLEVGTHFTEWISAQIELADLAENSDYCTFQEKLKLQFGPIQMAVEYFLTLDAAKMISLMSRHQKGKQYRRYLIDLEKEYKAQRDKGFLALNDIPEPFQAKFKGLFAATINALGQKSAMGLPKYPDDLGDPRVHGYVSNLLHKDYPKLIGEAQYVEAKKRKKAKKAKAVHQMITPMSLDMIRGVILGCATAAASMEQYEDLIDQLTNQRRQLAMNHIRFPERPPRPELPIEDERQLVFPENEAGA